MMKTTKASFLLAVCGAATLAFSSCQKHEEEVAIKEDISAETMNQVKALGFTTQNMKAVDGGVVVEGDILLSKELLKSAPAGSFLRVGDDEQYRTTNLVGGLPRTLTVSLSSQFSATYVSAADEAIRRYNAANLQLKFRRITSGTANLPITYSSDLGPGVLGQSGGFPQNGNPAPGFKLVPNVIGNQTVNAIATIMAHEMGHCIGFRHTDYMNRAYSCGGSASNEGASTVGAIRIPGTPSTADPNSWMLACVGNNVNRPFNSNDVIALNYLY
jgi:hypothetical protein